MHDIIYSRRHKNGDISVPRCSVKMEINTCPFHSTKNGYGMGAKEYSDKQCEQSRELQLARIRQLPSPRKPKIVLFQSICWFMGRLESISGT